MSTCSISLTKASRFGFKRMPITAGGFDDIANLYVANRSGQLVPLGALLDVRRVLGSELITRYNLYPAAPLIGRPAPGFQLRRGARHHGTDRKRQLAIEYGQRLDGAFVSGKAYRQPGLLYLRALHHAGISRTGRTIRKLDRSCGSCFDSAYGPVGRDRRADDPRIAQAISILRSVWC